MKFDLSMYKKTTDMMSLIGLLNSGATECNVIIRVKENFNLDFIKIRSAIAGDLVTASMATKELLKLESSPDVISYNVGKILKSY